MPSTIHKLNGVSIFHDEPYPFLDQAHALALMTEAAVRDDGGNGAPNDELVASALRGIATLVELASIGLASMDARRYARNAGESA